MEHLASTNQHLWGVKTLPGKWGDPFPLLEGLFAAVAVGLLIHMNEQICTIAQGSVLLSFFLKRASGGWQWHTWYTLYRLFTDLHVVFTHQN